MSSRRNFIQQLTAATGAFTFLPFTNKAFANEAESRYAQFRAMNDADAVADEDFWGWVKEQYTVSPNLLNLNNGGVSPQPKVVQDAHIRFYQYANEGPSYYMWRILDDGREALRGKLADLAGCDAEEIAINRNATEGLNTVIFGLNLKAGDEVVLTKQDYPNMINAWKQREKRDGIKLIWLNLELPIENEDAIVQQYVNAFTSRTKIVHVTHLINWTGQILPIRKIADEAHKRGIEVIGDGAHTFAHIDFNIPDLGCDYFASSLHKWLCAPFGSGLLWIKKEKIKNIWALLSNNEPDGTDIRKFESLGTRSFASEMAIGNAVDFHNVIGSKRKEERLRYLTDYWNNKVSDLKQVSFLQPKYKAGYCAISNIAIEGIKPFALMDTLHKKHKIHTVAIDWENVHGVRITPHVYTSIKDLDRLVNAIRTIAVG
ncbi:secreted protein [Lacibacter cauensis]|uniref:Secreted protein n=1 Tax=Lacibacter cauensis TaxID=510947 RepID=A0A562SCE5_9BACT|nr:aminotransferase class V-fold PLP-dependent enzyme [Lacibacter cauensis]TWI78260.1 secreted protein [Lacibacter cauensis]